MSTDQRIRRKIGLKSVMFLIGVIMILFYLILGSWLLLDKSFLPNFTGDFRYIFAGMLLVYGVYRSWRWYADTLRNDE